jgi:hypothetical protein
MTAMVTRKDFSPDAARDLAKDRNYAVIDALINNKKSQPIHSCKPDI